MGRWPCDDRCRDGLQAQGPWGTRSGKRQEGPSLEPPEAATTADTLTADMWSPDCERTNLCTVKPPVHGASVGQPHGMTTRPPCALLWGGYPGSTKLMSTTPYEMWQQAARGRMQARTVLILSLSGPPGLTELDSSLCSPSIHRTSHIEPSEQQAPGSSQLPSIPRYRVEVAYGSTGSASISVPL